jgi:hypothetical protein
MVLRFSSTDLNALAIDLLDVNGNTDGQNDQLVFEFDPWVTFERASCDCQLTLVALAGRNAVHGLSPAFFSAVPVDLRGDYAFRAAPVAEPSTGTLLVAGIFAFAVRRLPRARHQRTPTLALKGRVKISPAH